MNNVIMIIITRAKIMIMYIVNIIRIGIIYDSPYKGAMRPLSLLL